MARKIKVETPGEPTAPESTAEQAAASAPDAAALAAPAQTPIVAAPSPEEVVAAAAGPPPPTVEAQAKESALNAQLEKTKQLVGSGAALDWSHLTQPATIELKTKNADAELPNAADFDPFNIPFGQRVLTRQGWLLSAAPDPRARQG